MFRTALIAVDVPVLNESVSASLTLTYPFNISVLLLHAVFASCSGSVNLLLLYCMCERFVQNVSIVVQSIYGNYIIKL